MSTHNVLPEAANSRPPKVTWDYLSFIQYVETNMEKAEVFLQQLHMFTLSVDLGTHRDHWGGSRGVQV